MQMSLSMGVCWPPLPSGEATLGQSHGGKVERDHEKEPSPCPHVWHVCVCAVNNNRSSDAG